MKNNEIIENIEVIKLKPFSNHPFKMRLGEEQQELEKSIKQQGTIMPLIVRSSSDSKYEIISGHRRYEACKNLGLEKVPVIIRNMSDDEAVMAMVDANLQRESILPSEKAFAYKMKMEALKCQGKRIDLETSLQNAAKFRTDDKIASSLGISGDTLQRYIRLTYLIPELLKM